MKGLINNIESQRDNYKHQVEKLIKDLQSKDKVIIVEKDVDEPDRRGRRTIVSQPRGQQEVLPECLPAPGGEEVSVSLELLQVRLDLAENKAQLDQAREEIIKLRRELGTLQSQLDLHNVKETQTLSSPS